MKEIDFLRTALAEREQRAPRTAVVLEHITAHEGSSVHEIEEATGVGRRDVLDCLEDLRCAGRIRYTLGADGSGKKGPLYWLPESAA